jgi:hypothetical protein
LLLAHDQAEILSMFDPTTLVGFHTWLSLIALGAGLIVAAGLARGQNYPTWTALFLATAVGTSVTGFLFPFSGVLPSHVVGGIALVVLAAAVLALYAFHLAGPWRRIYAVTAVASVYFLVFVAIAQAFLKIPALHASAPTGTETPFIAAQLVALVAFVALAIVAARAFRPSRAGTRPLPV